jgi:hypothetical protein
MHLDLPNLRRLDNYTGEAPIQSSAMLRQVASHFCPEAVPMIERWIRVARFELP